MNSNWQAEIKAVFLKELHTELRGKTGLVTGGVFTLATTVTVALALYNKDANSKNLKDVCAALLWIVLIFASLLTLPRTFLAEEEQGTADLLRLVARPHAVFWGKILMNLAQVWVLGLVVSVLFVGLTGLTVSYVAIFAGSLMGGGAALAGTVTLCGAVASHAQNRATLAGAIALVLVLAPCQWGVTGLQASLGVEPIGNGYAAVGGLSAYATLMLAVGPWIYAAVWKS